MRCHRAMVTCLLAVWCAVCLASVALASPSPALLETETDRATDSRHRLQAAHHLGPSAGGDGSGTGSALRGVPAVSGAVPQTSAAASSPVTASDSMAPPPSSADALSSSLSSLSGSGSGSDALSSGSSGSSGLPSLSSTSLEGTGLLSPVQSQRNSVSDALEGLASSRSSSSQSSKQKPNPPSPVANPDADQPDMVGHLIDRVMRGQPLRTSRQGSTVALGNKNEIQKDEASDADMHQEELVKKATEAGKKKDQEERAKISSEARRKTDSIERLKIHNEEAAKQFDDDLRSQAQQARQKGREETNKQTEQAEKKVDEAANKRSIQLAAAKRAEALLDAQSRAGEAQLKAVSEMERKKAAEAIKKSNDEAALKLSESQRKFEAEVTQKKTAELRNKKAKEAERKEKFEAKAKEQETKDEQMKKQQEREAEQNTKEAAQKSEQDEKVRQQQAVGRWCDGSCSNVKVNFFGESNSWFICPDGTLFTGMFRGPGPGIDQLGFFQCCKPCRDDTKTEMEVNACEPMEVSMSSSGWKVCGGQKYVQGMFKSNCQQMSCITQLRCCDINSSRARRQCAGSPRFFQTSQQAGWSVLDNDHFASGFFTDGQWGISGMRTPFQCSFWAY